jgi:hypothetical protein
MLRKVQNRRVNGVTRKAVALVFLIMALGVWMSGIFAFARGSTLFGLTLTVGGGLLMMRLAAAYQRTGDDARADGGMWQAIRDGFAGFWP